MTLARHMSRRLGSAHDARGRRRDRLRPRDQALRGTDKAAVEELSLTIPAGEICVLVGPSGAGKTTAMKIVNRLVELDAGDVRIDGRSVATRRRSSCAGASAT